MLWLNHVINDKVAVVAYLALRLGYDRKGFYVGNFNAIC